MFEKLGNLRQTTYWNKQARLMQDLRKRKTKLVRRARWRLAETLVRPEVGTSDQWGPQRWPPFFFIVGHPRSGTNWLMRALNAHPEILCRGEGRFFGRERRIEKLKDMQTTEHIKQKIQPASLYNALADSEHLRLWVERSVWTRDENPEEQLMLLTRQAIYYFLTQSLLETDKRMVGDKTPLVSPKVVREISRICPEAKVIHIIRDGRDVVISATHHEWNRATDEGGIHDLSPEDLNKRDRYRQDPQAFLASGESIFSEERIVEASRKWRRKVGRTYQDGPTLLGSDYTEVRYEDLLKQPRKEFGSLFKFLGAEVDPEIVARCVRATSFKKRTSGRERGQEDTRSGVRKGIAGDWRNVFTERDREIFKEEAGDLLVELGYEKDKNW